MWTRHAALVVLAVLLVPCLALAEAEEALYNCKKRTNPVAITFKSELELKDLLTWVVGFTCKEFVLDPRIVATGRKVTIIAPNTMSSAEAYQVFVVALSTIGLTVVPKGKVYRIVEAATAPHDSVPIYPEGSPPGSTDQVVRYVFRPAHAPADTLRQAFGAMKSAAGDIQLIGSLLVLTDYASNVRDMLSIAKLVDVPGGTDGIYTIPVHHADAAKLLDKLTGFLGVGVTAGGKLETTVAAVPTKIMVDERTNTLILASSDAAYQRVKALVERIDVALEIEGGAAIHVYQLGNAIADELAKTLNEAIQSQGQSQPKTGAPSAASTSSPVDTLGAKLEGQAKVISDTPTNKLIVMSSGRDFLAIREVIKELDVPRRQVYIETTILEVAVGNGLELGSSSHAGYNLDGNRALMVGGVQTGNVRSLNLSTLTTASGLIGGIIGKTLATKSILGTSIPSYAILFQALADTSRTNILSTPVLLALDNEQAKYKVGTNIPYKKGVMPTTSTTATSSLTTNIDRRDLVLDLDIKPHISTNDSILLELKLTSDDLGDATGELGPSWNTRYFETRVLVRDQATVVVGGLMQEREVATSSKVPVLGDIPILGYLFKSSSKSKKKTTLLVMLTPYIIKDQNELEQIRSRKVREYDEFVGSFKALDGMSYRPRVDYRRKYGLVEEINRAVLEVEADGIARAQVRAPKPLESGLVSPVPSPSTDEVPESTLPGSPPGRSTLF